MQKRNVIIFGLSLIFILLIAGCQQAVGGTGKRTVYSSTDSSYTRTDYGSNTNIQLNIRGTCTNYFDAPALGSHITGFGNTCSEVVGCVSLGLSDMGATKSAKVQEIIMIRQLTSEQACGQDRNTLDFSNGGFGEYNNFLQSNYGISIASIN